MTLPAEPGFSFGNTADDDGVADPEVGPNTIEDITTFLELLGPPPRQSTDPERERDGEALFTSSGCAACHVPVLRTTDGVDVPLYSDLLLHDVSDGDAGGIVDGDAGIRDFRTPPLWGASETAPYMHDGRATTFEAAIAKHGTEAAESRRAVESLDVEQRAALLAFLESL